MISKAYEYGDRLQTNPDLRVVSPYVAGVTDGGYQPEFGSGDSQNIRAELSIYKHINRRRLKIMALKNQAEDLEYELKYLDGVLRDFNSNSLSVGQVRYALRRDTIDKKAKGIKYDIG
jgi:hypothetical protein